jgi:hypothetical protein
MPVAHACTPSYSGDRNQEDQFQSQPQANSLGDPILEKNTYHKKGLVEWLKV